MIRFANKKTGDISTYEFLKSDFIELLNSIMEPIEVNGKRYGYGNFLERMDNKEFREQFSEWLVSENWIFGGLAVIPEYSDCRID